MVSANASVDEADESEAHESSGIWICGPAPFVNR